MKNHSGKVFKILHVVSRLPVGGVENMLFKTLTRYDKENFEVMVCCIKEGGETADTLREAGYRVMVLGRMKRSALDPGAVTGLYTLIKKEGIHILRTHSYHANLYGRLAGKLAGVPVIIPSFHDQYNSQKAPKRHRRIVNYILGTFSDALIAVSGAVARDMEHYDKIDRKRITVVHNGVAIDEFRREISREEARRIFGIPDNRTVIGSVGRLTRQKGHRYLVEAVSGMRDSVVAIAGDGPLRGVLRDLAENLNVTCVFTGQLSPEKIPLFLHSLDIFCFPSLWEGFGTTLIEAMAAGLPVIASDIPPHREVMGDAGIYHVPGDAQALVRKIEMLVEKPSLRNDLSRKAEKRAEDFSIEKTVQTYENLFRTILLKKGLYGAV